jgi:hypothetical protein
MSGAPDPHDARLDKLELKVEALDEKVDDLRVFQGWVMGGLAVIGGLIAALAAGLGKIFKVMSS